LNILRIKVGDFGISKHIPVKWGFRHEGEDPNMVGLADETKYD